MTETIRANILNEYRVTDAINNTELYSIIDRISNLPEGESQARLYLLLNGRLREAINTDNMLLPMLLDGDVTIFELDVKANGTSWNVEPQWGDDEKLLYFELSNPIKVHEQVNV